MSTIEGFQVFETQPDFATAPKLTVSREMRLSSIGESRRLAQFTGKHIKHGFAHRHVLNTREAIHELSDFFHARAGRWQPFWLPSWHAELNPVAGIVNGGNALSITPIQYQDRFIDSDLRRLGNFIFLLRTDGLLHLTQVESATTANPEVLTLGTAVPSAFPLGSFFAGFLYFVRFVNDRLDLEFNGASFATTSLQMIETTNVIQVGADESNPKSGTEQGAWKDNDDAQFKDHDGVSWKF